LLRAVAALLMAGGAAVAAWSTLGGPPLGGWAFGALLAAGVLWLVEGAMHHRSGGSQGAGNDPGRRGGDGESAADGGDGGTG
jgi:hypothetical protein